MTSDALIKRLSERWLLPRGTPSVPQPHLPVALVASLGVGERVRDSKGTEQIVTAVGPGALCLESQGTVTVYTNRGYRPYSWAYFAAPRLCWIVE